MRSRWDRRSDDEDPMEAGPTVTITVPEADNRGFIERHEAEYQSAYAAMSPSRTWGAEFTKSSFRRLLRGIDPQHQNGWAFSGLELRAGEPATVPVGGLMLTVDKSFARGNWYAGRSVTAASFVAVLYEATENGELKELLVSMDPRKWGRELVGWLLTNRPDLPRVTVVPRTPRR
jgi:hypothetical protein